MQDAENLDSIPLDPIDRNERGPVYHKFACTFDATNSAHQRVFGEAVCLALNLFIEFDGGRWVVSGDEVQLLKPVLCGRLEPTNGQLAAFFSMRVLPSHAARLIALCRFTSD